MIIMVYEMNFTPAFIRVRYFAQIETKGCTHITRLGVRLILAISVFWGLGQKTQRAAYSTLD